MLMNRGQADSQQKESMTEAARIIRLFRTPLYQMDLTRMQETFLMVIKEIKHDMDSSVETSKALTKDIFDKLMVELSKGQETNTLSFTPEQMADAIVNVTGDLLPEPEKLTEFRNGIASLFANLPQYGTQ